MVSTSPSSEPDAKPHSAFAALCLAALLLSGGYGTWFWLARARGPAAADYPKATDLIRSEYRSGDLIFLVPFYATRAREQLGDFEPLTVRDPLLEDFAVHPRAWVFGILGEAEKLRPRMTAAGYRLARSLEPAPGIAVDLYETGSMTVEYAFMDHLRDARVAHEKDGSRTPCAAWSPTNGQGGPMGRWSCPYDSEWFYVAPEWHRMGEQMRRCMWAHPPNQGRLLVSYPNVPLRGHLYGRGGHTANSSVFARAPVNLEVTVGDLPAQRFKFELKDTDRPFMLSIPETGTATVTFAISSPDAGTNHFCFWADIRR